MATELGTAYLSIAASTGGLGKSISSAFAGTQGIADAAGKNAGKGFMGGFALGGAIAGVASQVLGRVIDGIAGLAAEAVSASDATDKFKTSLQFAGLKNTAIESATKTAREYADQTVYDLADIQNTSAQLASNGIKDYTGLTKAAGNLNAVAGGNAQTFKSVAMVLTQTAGAGKLTTENWNQLADAIPGASGPIQAALKKNGAFTGNFRDAMAKGEISADEFNKALLELGTKPVAVEAAKSTKTFEGAIGNLKATIVGGLSDGLNAIKPALTGSINFISSAIGKGFDYVGKFAGTVGKWAQPIVDMFKTAGGGAAGFQAALGRLSIGGLDLGPLVTAAGQIVSTLSPVGLLIKSMAPLLPQLGAAFAQIAQQGLAILVPLLAQVGPMFAQVSAVLVSAGTQIASALLPVLTQLVQAALPVIGQVIAAVVPVVMQLAQAFLPLVGVVAQLITSLLPPLASLVTGLLPAIAPLVGAVMAVIQALLPIVGIIIQLVQTLIPPLMSVINALVPPIVNLVSTIAGALVPILSAIAELFSALMPIIAGVVGVLGRIVAAVVPVIAVIVGGLVGALAGLIGWIARVVSAILSFVGRGIAAVARFVSSIGTNLGKVGNFFRELPGKIVGLLGNLGGKLVASGRALVDGFLDGIKKGWDTLTGWVKKGMETLRGLWPFSPAKWGPFSGRGYVTHSGAALTADFAASLARGQSTVRKAALGVMEAANLTGNASALGFGAGDGVPVAGGPNVQAVFHGADYDQSQKVVADLMGAIGAATRRTAAGFGV